MARAAAWAIWLFAPTKSARICVWLLVPSVLTETTLGFADTEADSTAVVTAGIAPALDWTTTVVVTVLPPDVALVTPGIRPRDAKADDQTRIMTPAEAARGGARYIVVGRPIFRAPDPAAAAKAILAELLANGGGDAAAIAAAKGFEAIDTSALEAVVDQVIAEQADAWAKFCAGDGKAMGAIVGAVMKATQGKADGKAVTALLNKKKG